ncbi:MAG TPA: sulfite exporter TauE/SafE family protein [Actinomycetota bacterium]|nr:sulfite exporter TauE/SafE family protein [Actinomycetota bacterium]
MRKLVLFGMVGVLAQLVDGALGMAYGLTSTTMLVAVGTAPALASATVHLAELGTTAVSGVSHWRFGNVDWRTVRLMTFPGAVGAFLGAVALSSVSGEVARPWVAAILSSLGVYVLFRFLGTARGPRPVGGRPLASGVLAPLGLGAGFLDAVGGGGWGPVGTPTLLASGRLEPRKVIGSVDTGEFLVALGASLGFLVSLGWRQVPLSLVLLLLAGGLVAAPLAAWLVKRLAPRKLGVIVGAAILLTNARTLASAFGVEGAWRATLYLSIVTVVGALAAWRLTQSRRAAGPWPPWPPVDNRSHHPGFAQPVPTGQLTPVPWSGQ